MVILFLHLIVTVVDVQDNGRRDERVKLSRTAKGDCAFWKPACQLLDSMSRKTRGLTRSLGPATTLNGRPKISLP